MGILENQKAGPERDEIHLGRDLNTWVINKISVTLPYNIIPTKDRWSKKKSSNYMYRGLNESTNMVIVFKTLLKHSLFWPRCIKNVYDGYFYDKMWNETTTFSYHNYHQVAQGEVTPMFIYLLQIFRISQSKWVRLLD